MLEHSTPASSQHKEVCQQIKSH